ncbi:hypothetical protein DFH06DRAFT_1126893 [Mycena polygramma]|nr:hypothetical protein DFH06DRAFT_1126893 [Mycena polygramma]
MSAISAIPGAAARRLRGTKNTPSNDGDDPRCSENETRTYLQEIPARGKPRYSVGVGATPRRLRSELRTAHAGCNHHSRRIEYAGDTCLPAAKKLRKNGSKWNARDRKDASSPAGWRCSRESDISCWDRIRSKEWNGREDREGGGGGGGGEKRRWVVRFQGRATCSKYNSTRGAAAFSDSLPDWDTEQVRGIPSVAGSMVQMHLRAADTVEYFEENWWPGISQEAPADEFRHSTVAPHLGRRFTVFTKIDMKQQRLAKKVMISQARAGTSLDRDPEDMRIEPLRNKEQDGNALGLEWAGSWTVALKSRWSLLPSREASQKVQP